MADYRLYFMNPQGHIVDAVEFLSDDDEKAQAIAKRQSVGRATELWSGARVVHRYEKPLSAA